MDIAQRYRLIISALFGLRQDFEECFVSEDAVQILDELIETCLSDYRIRFAEDGPARDEEA